ncbi:MAG: hypothetical protein DIU55_001650 [Bacillota bacterium]
MSPSFLQALLTRLREEPAVLAVYVDRSSSEPDSGEVHEVTLHLAVEGAFAQGVGAWASALPDVIYSGPEPHGWTVITADGVEWRLCLCAGADVPAGLEPVFDRREPRGGPAAPPKAAGAAQGGAAVPDLAALVGAFWRDLYRAGRAIRAGRTLTAHHWLFTCGGHLIDLYRLALQPDSPGRGWVGADEVPGLARALEPVRPFLSAALEGRSQRRAAHKLAEAFEGLVLPLCQRLGLAYPMALRTLAFRSLEPEPTPDVPGPGSGADPGSRAKP